MKEFVISWKTPTAARTSYYAGRNKYADLNGAKMFDTRDEAKKQLLKIQATAGKPEYYQIVKLSSIHRMVNTPYGEVMLKPNLEDLNSCEVYIGDNYDDYLCDIDCHFDSSDKTIIDLLTNKI